ncbi:MAG TPA: ABC transporter permease [Chloroflexi bacterium]|jgi:ABC-2 type transport system permease protein|nr:ABC transporter permease [Chloroflexota bacterium]
MASQLIPALFRISRLVRKELEQLYSDKFFAALLVALPLTLLFLIVNAAGEDGGAPEAIAVIDQDLTAGSRRIVEALENTGALRVQTRLTRLADGERALYEGSIYGLVVIPDGYERDLLANAGPEILIVVDGSNTLVAGQVLSAAGGAISHQAHPAHAAGSGGIRLDVRSTQFRGVTARQSLVAPQLGFLLYQVVLLVAGLSIVRESETGTLEQLLVTPLSRLELIIGKMLPPLLVGVVNFWALYFAARLFWDLPARGSIALLFFTAVLFILSESAWGLFLSSRVARQQQATQLIFVQILFDLAFCGYMVPVTNLPRFMAWISELLPLRHYLVCVRSILLRGGDLTAIWIHVVALIALNLAFWSLSVVSLRRRLR